MGGLAGFQLQAQRSSLFSFNNSPLNSSSVGLFPVSKSPYNLQNRSRLIRPRWRVIQHSLRWSCPQYLLLQKRPLSPTPNVQRRRKISGLQSRLSSLSHPVSLSLSLSQSPSPQVYLQQVLPLQNPPRLSSHQHLLLPLSNPPPPNLLRPLLESLPTPRLQMETPLLPAAPRSQHQRPKPNPPHRNNPLSTFGIAEKKSLLPGMRHLRNRPQQHYNHLCPHHDRP